MSIIVKVAKSKKGTKYLAVYECKDDNQRFISCDFSTVKRLLNINPYAKIDDDYLMQYEAGQILYKVGE